MWHMNCLFCKIVSGEIPSTKVYENEWVLAFQDIQPCAPVHVLLIPKKHIASLNEVTEEDAEILAHLQLAIPQIANQLNIQANGYRVVSNTGFDGGQTVFHLHYHIIGDKKMAWPPFPG